MTITKYLIIDTKPTVDVTPQRPRDLRAMFAVQKECWTQKEAEEAIEKTTWANKDTLRVVPINYEVEWSPGWPIIRIENHFTGEGDSSNWNKLTRSGYQILDLIRAVCPEDAPISQFGDVTLGIHRAIADRFRSLETSDQLLGNRLVSKLLNESFSCGDTGSAKVLSALKESSDEFIRTMSVNAIRAYLLNELYMRQNEKLYVTPLSARLSVFSNKLNNETTIYGLRRVNETDEGACELKLVSWTCDPIRDPKTNEVVKHPSTGEVLNQVRALAVNGSSNLYSLRSTLLTDPKDLFTGKKFLYLANTTPTYALYGQLVASYNTLAGNENLTEQARAELNKNFAIVTNIPLATLDLSNIRK